MNRQVILWWFGVAVLITGALSIVPLAIAAFNQTNDLIQPFILTLLLCGFLGGALILIAQGHDDTNVSRNGVREISILLMAFWTLIPILISIPLYKQGYDFIEAWFEGVAALTTTGAWLSWDKATDLTSLMIWRAILQWWGGLISLSAAAAVFIRAEFIGLKNLSTPFSLGEQESYLRAFRVAVINFLPYYAGLTFLTIIILAASGLSIDLSVTFGLSLMASGGFLVDLEAVREQLPFILPLISFVMILSAVSFVSVVYACKVDLKKIRTNKELETPTFLFCAALATLLFYWSNPESDVFTQAFNALSVLSTNGLLIGDKPAFAPVLVTAVIGGAAISTAGGLKLIRWIATFRRADEELWRLIHPRAVSKRAKASDELAIWVHYIAFTIILAMFVLIIGAFGFDLEMSMATAAAVFSNSGPIIEIATTASNYEIFPDPLLFLLGIGMIAGRLEMVIALTLFSGYFWRN